MEKTKVSFRDFYEVFEKQHRGTQKMTRTQDFGCGRLGGVLGHLGPNHKNGAESQRTETFFGGSFDVFGPVEISISKFRDP